MMETAKGLDHWRSQETPGNFFDCRKHGQLSWSAADSRLEAV